MQQQGRLIGKMPRVAEYFIASFALVVLYLTLLGGAYLGYKVLIAPDKGGADLPKIVAGGLVIGLGFLVSIGIISYGIDKQHIRFFPDFMLFATGLVVAAMLIVHGKMVAKALGQEYGLKKFVLHVLLLMIVASVALVMEQIHSYHPTSSTTFKTWYVIALLSQEAAHFLGMVMRYVMFPPPEPFHVLYDLAIFGLALFIALVFLERICLTINYLAYKLTKTILTV